MKLSIQSSQRFPEQENFRQCFPKLVIISDVYENSCINLQLSLNLSIPKLFVDHQKNFVSTVVVAVTEPVQLNTDVDEVRFNYLKLLAGQVL